MGITKTKWDIIFANDPTLGALSAPIRSQITARWLNKYMKAVLMSRSEAAEIRAWLALYNYLTYPWSARKPFSISPTAADVIIIALQNEVQPLRN